MIMNIEKTISEHAVSDILTPMLDCQDRIVTEDVAPLFDAATGLDTPPASGTVTTTIEESRNLITAIIRKAWTATLTMLGGASVIGYITAAYTYLRNRLQGSETYGIPDRRSEISASSPLAANLALLNDRKIGGVPEAVDGMSMARILCGAYSDITELTDDNSGWDCKQGMIAKVLDIFPNLESLVLGCGSMTDTTGIVSRPNLKRVSCPNMTYLKGKFMDNCDIDEIEFPSLTYWEPTAQQFRGQKRLLFPELDEIYQNGTFYTLAYNSTLEEFYAPKLRILRTYSSNAFFQGSASLKKVVFGQIQNPTYHDAFMQGCTNLIHLEFGADGNLVNTSLTTFKTWNPTNALDASRTDLIEEGSTAQNNLQQFLSNFRDYIALRLTDNGSGKTLTLSQAVRNAIHAAESTYGIENIIITQKGWTISPAPN